MSSSAETPAFGHDRSPPAPSSLEPSRALEAELHVRCNLCGADDAEVVYPAGIAQIAQIVRCRHCRLMYANPRGRRPDHEDVETWKPEWNLVEQDKQKIDKQRGQVVDYAETRAFLQKLYPRRGDLLEIGSGLGFLLKYFKADGWNVLGVEPFAEGCAYAKRVNGVDAIPAILENANIPSASRDVVLMMHVIEHVPNPLQTLGEIYRVLKPGGYACLETPRFDTLAFKILGHRERSLSCNGHIYFYTTDTLRRSYEKVGFRPIKTDYVGRSLTLERLLWNLNVMSKNVLDEAKLVETARRLRLDELRLHLNARDMQRVIIQKPF